MGPGLRRDDSCFFVCCGTRDLRPDNGYAFFNLDAALHRRPGEGRTNADYKLPGHKKAAGLEAQHGSRPAPGRQWFFACCGTRDLRPDNGYALFNIGAGAALHRRPGEGRDPCGLRTNAASEKAAGMEAQHGSRPAPGRQWFFLRAAGPGTSDRITATRSSMWTPHSTVVPAKAGTHADHDRTRPWPVPQAPTPSLSPACPGTTGVQAFGYATTSCCCSPNPAIPRRSLSPFLRKRCGVRPMPTPGGVPVVMMSPGSSVMKRDT